MAGACVNRACVAEWNFAISRLLSPAGLVNNIPRDVGRYPHDHPLLYSTLSVVFLIEPTSELGLDATQVLHNVMLSESAT